jgi:hypothetical protein
VKTVDEIMTEEFAKPWAWRSLEYKAGVRAGLEWLINGKEIFYPYPIDSAQADAYGIGVLDAHNVWERQRKCSSPTSAAHAEQKTCAEDQDGEANDPAPAARAHEPEAQEQDPKETDIQAADKPAAKKRGRPRKQAAETLATEVAQ